MTGLLGSGSTGENRRFDSASGLKPTTAFVLVALVFGLIALKAGKIALWDEGGEPHNLIQQHVPDVTFDILDSNGTPMALSVERLELVMSPNATWQAHTPDRLAELLSGALGLQYPKDRLLEAMLPDARPDAGPNGRLDSRKGTIHVRSRPLLLDASKARAVDGWIRTGSTRAGADQPPVQPVPIPGVRIEAGPEPGLWAIAWQPAVLLGERARAEHGFSRPLDWSRQIADDLFACVRGQPIREALASDDEVSAARREIWAALMPCQFKCVVKEVPPETAMAVWNLLKEERVRGHQIDLVRVGRRVYPARGSAREDPPLAVLGRWGTLEPAQAETRARASLGLPADRPCREPDLDLLRSLTARWVYQPRPTSGIELLGERLLERPEWCDLDRRSEQYTYLANQAPRQPLQRYFQELNPAGETPHLVTTIDLPLQRQMRLELERVMVLHRPAAAMAIALDVPTGKVLAVDAIDPYGIGGFLPVLHTFTPGSTMKVVVMATALEAGVVKPEDKIDTFDGHLRLGSRAIGEAENSRTGIITAAEGLAYSCNAVLVQIGLRIPSEVLHARFLELGYSRSPDAGLGGERCGWVPKLPWARNYSHASVSFGHEMLVTLWQHAAALATVVRGGEYRPLALIEAVEQGGVRRAVPLAEPRRVFSQSTCEAVRAMMEMGAREGTGKKVYCPYLLMGTKTGTAQKVADEPCLHVELEHNRVHGCHGKKACRRSLAGVHTAHRGGCYTSSMCAYGRLPGTEREVMVLVVVDEPRGGRKFGSDVAGPAAAAILEEALGSRRGGVRPPELSPEGFAGLDPLASGARALTGRGAQPLPWEEDRLAAR